MSEHKDQYQVSRLFVYHPGLKIWSFEPYIKCSFRCIYCSSDSQGKSTPAVQSDHFDEVLKRELARIQQASVEQSGSLKIAISLFTDGYVPEEADYCFTRRCLQQLIEQKTPFEILTKGTLIERDMDVINQAKTDYNVYVSITSHAGNISSATEPKVPLIEDRVKLIANLFSRGLRVTANIAPWIPESTDVERIMQLLPDGIPVSICALEYQELFNKRYFSERLMTEKLKVLEAGALSEWIQDMFIKGISNTTRAVYSKRWSQDDINNLYYEERKRLGYSKNVFWARPPKWKGSQSINHCFLSLDIDD